MALHAASTALSFGLQAVPTLASEDARPRCTTSKLHGLYHGGWLVILSTAIDCYHGDWRTWRLFVIALPFRCDRPGGIRAAGKALVVDPGKAAFVRCPGLPRVMVTTAQ